MPNARARAAAMSTLFYTDVLSISCPCGTPPVEVPVTLAGWTLPCAACGREHTIPGPAIATEPDGVPFAVPAEIADPVTSLPPDPAGAPRALAYASNPGAARPTFAPRPVLCCGAILYALLLAAVHLAIGGIAGIVSTGRAYDRLPISVLLTLAACGIIVAGSVGLITRSAFLRNLLRAGAIADLLITFGQLAYVMVAAATFGGGAAFMGMALLVVRGLSDVCLLNAARRTPTHAHGYNRAVWE
jgi:hypothetical protein